MSDNLISHCSVITYGGRLYLAYKFFREDKWLRIPLEQ